MNGLNSRNETKREHSLAPTDNMNYLIRFFISKSKVKVTAGSRDSEGIRVDAGVLNSIFQLTHARFLPLCQNAICLSSLSDSE